MKAYVIGLFLLCIQVSAALVDTTGIFQHNTRFKLEDIEWANQTVRGQDFNGSQTGGSTEYDLAVRYNMFDVLGRMLNVKATLLNFGIPEILTNILAIPVYVMWIWGFIQFLWRKSITDQS